MLRSWLVYEGPIRNALHDLKYHRTLALSDALAQPLAKYVGTLSWSLDMVIPVPLGKNRTKERGYNQGGLVAMPLAVINHWRNTPRALVRSRKTKSQVGLTITERKMNVSGPFRADKALVSGKTIKVMDDVATTGATPTACVSALLDAGVRNIYALTLARVLPHHGLNNV
jgi:ComF family protein